MTKCNNDTIIKRHVHKKELVHKLRHILKTKLTGLAKLKGSAGL